MIKKDLTNKKFGKLTVIEHAGFYITPSSGYKKSKWKCLCECGNYTITTVSSLNKGRTKSCGCFRLEQISKKMRKKPGEAASYRLYSEYRQSAKKRNIEFKLNKDEFLKITKKDCFYCGIKPSQYKNDMSISEKWRLESKYIYNGIDRVNNKEDYNLFNCVACCKFCNIGKGTKTIEEFKEWIERVYNFSVKNG